MNHCPLVGEFCLFPPQFLRGAGEKYAKLGLMAARHMERVDYIRVHPNESVEGLFFFHRPAHSNYYPWAQNPDLIDQWDIVVK